MPTTRASKRTFSRQNAERPTKRPRQTAVSEPEDVIVIESDSEGEVDEEMKDIMAQIKAQEASERLARQLQNQYDEPSSSSGSRNVPIVVEDDAALARRLAEEWAREDNEKDASTVDDFESVSGQSHTEKKTSQVDSGSPISSTITNYSFSSVTVAPDEALESFKGVFTQTRGCSKCQKEVDSPRGCVMFSEASSPPSMTHLLHAACPSCRMNHCRGCFKPINCTPSCKGPSKNSKCSVLNCCADVRAIAIFETLGGFDRQFIAERAAADSRALALSNAKSNNKGKSVGPGGTGYGMGGQSYGYSFSSSQHGKTAKTSRQPANPKHKKVADHWDTVILRTLNILVSLLPAPYADDANVYDMLPHASIGHLISLSQIPTLLADLLRNDSVTDWISRKDIYNAMLSLLRRMADCELTIHSLIAQRWEIDSACGLENWMWDEGEIAWKRNNQDEIETSPALYTYFTKLTKQSEAFLAGATQMLGADDADAEVEEMMIQGTSLCGDIIAARDDLERAISVLGQPASNRENRVEKGEDDSNGKQRTKKGKGKGREVSIDFDKVYAEACEKLAFKHVPLAEPHNYSGGGLTYANYNYAQQLTQTQNSTRLPKDRLHLLKELAVMATSLPPGVWVRVDEVRNDAIKIMIAGPDGTPYAGGLFEFDCFIPVQYPARPPLMHLRTTGGGSVRFNPNLYNDGKVCLSLLGTWPGPPEERWSPKSTLLQVLVSIQSMILIDAPYFNEPGHGQANLKAHASIAYNRNISKQTTRWAIVDWLSDKHRNGIWRDVIASHFTIRKHKIREQIIEWSRTDPQIRAYTASSSLYDGYNYYQATSQPVDVKQGMDLLEAFDKCMELVESWGAREDGA